MPAEQQLCPQHWGPSFLFPISPLPPTHTHSNSALDLVSTWGAVTGHNPIVLPQQPNGWDSSKPPNPPIMDLVVTRGQARLLVRCLGTTELCPWGYSMPLKDQPAEVTEMEEKNLETQQFHLLIQLKYMKKNPARTIP